MDTNCRPCLIDRFALQDEWDTYLKPVLINLQLANKATVKIITVIPTHYYKKYRVKTVIYSVVDGSEA